MDQRSDRHFPISTPVIWLTGLSGAGKSTIASGTRVRLLAWGATAVILDADEIRSGLNDGLGFGHEDRTENIRRIAHVARLLSRQSVLPIVAAVSPLEVHRALARQIIGEGYFEVFVDTPLAVCETRDVKGLYARVRRNEISEFTGISAPYERPASPHLTIDTTNSTPVTAVETLMQALPALVWTEASD